MRARQDIALLVAAAAAAVTAPLALRRLVQDRLHEDVEPALSRAIGEEVSIGDVEVTLDGALRLDRIAVGDMLTADAVWASVGLGSILRGTFSADEVTVARPRIAAALRPDGTLDWAELLERVRDARRQARGAGDTAPAGGGMKRPRRIVVTGGELVVTVAGRGEVRARGVELHPQEGGVRVVAAGLSLAVTDGPWRLTADFARSGLDVTLPRLHVDRAALDGGRVTIAAGSAEPLALDHVVVARGLERDDRETRVDGRLARGGDPVKLRLRRDRAGGGVEVEAEVSALPLGAFAPALPGWIDASHAVATGRVVGSYRGGLLAADGAADVRDLGVAHSLIASETVPFGGSFTFEASWDVPARAGRLALQGSSGAVVLDAELEVVLGPTGTPSRAHLKATVPPTPCAAALASIPLPLRRRLDGLMLDGSLGAELEVGFDRAAGTAVLRPDLEVGCRISKDATSADVAALDGPATHRLPDGTVRRLDDEDPDFVELDDLPDHVVGAFVAGEDARFYRHDGFDLEQLRRSFEIDVRAGRVERGGSTISQQLVKNLYLTRERTLARKLLEAVLTWRLEARIDKERILEVYLNIIELGEGTYGLEPAARRWFDKEPKELTVAEAAFLAALTPSPVTTDRRLRAAGVLDPDTDRRVRAVLRSMRLNRVIDEPTYRRALREELEVRIGEPTAAL